MDSFLDRVVAEVAATAKERAKKAVALDRWERPNLRGVPRKHHRWFDEWAAIIEVPAKEYPRCFWVDHWGDTSHFLSPEVLEWLKEHVGVAGYHWSVCDFTDAIGKYHVYLGFRVPQMVVPFQFEWRGVPNSMFG
jgi:hypothetical protein